ncbi:hypothetical protein JQ616_00050 [Bradyrhizobium tropiciagri]|nr:hypothetical protein [Bradyrhizobium tropiciagri]MBR0893321.1 hypothetical protein [Bradyrhizobium tropiciagri]
MRWRSMTETTNTVLDTTPENTFYAVGWTVSGVAMLATVVAVWMFGI